MEESIEVEDSEFVWGKKRGIGGKKKDVQFYESFTYDGEEYRLYDCVLACKEGEPEPFVGKIIKIWEHPRMENGRRVKLLWFFKPSEISSYLEGVLDILPNELFLASGKGDGLTDVNPLEAIGGKCSVLCISKDKRNPQPSDEEIKNAHFVFRRTFDVLRCKVLDQIDDKIAEIDVKFIFNRTSENKSSAAEKVVADITVSPDSVKPECPSTSALVRLNQLGSSESPSCGENGLSGKKAKEHEGHKQMARKKSIHAVEVSTKDSVGRDVEGHTDCDSSEASVSRRDHWDGKKAEESKVRKHLTKQKSVVEEKESTKDSGERDGRSHSERGSSGVSGSPRSHWDGKKVQECKTQKRLSKQKSMVGEERYSKDPDGLGQRPHKKQKLDGSGAVSGGRSIEILQKISSNGAKDIKSVSSHRDIVTKREVLSQRPSFVDKKQGLQVTSGYDGKVTKTVAPVVRPIDKAPIGKSLSKKLSSDEQLSKRTEGKILTEDDYKRNHQVIEVTRRPDAERRKWFRDLAWEERMRGAEEHGTLVLLQNLDPTYTSDEVEDIVYSALKEQCTARMIARTSISIPHIGEALLIFKRREIAEKVVQRLKDGCLMLSNGRPLVATFAKLAPPGKPSSFFGHFKVKTQMQRDMRDAVATSHCSQPNTVEYDMAMEWCLHQSRYDAAWEKLLKQQREEIKKLRVDFKHKTSLASETSGPSSNLKVAVTDRT
ncbi:PREDICTED: protein ANTI-SILENCING 1 [Tarenaya hassleriana]|uniref:protein ANTI-SILENCING 1 n=1 Tax=Tarenaya hassleriana TaxID=28532 RepID=UPI00053C365C|nr:PREDICTED: protein ANTI-SILENCING 1 [Tarenaya hassleriana]